MTFIYSSNAEGITGPLVLFNDNKQHTLCSHLFFAELWFSEKWGILPSGTQELNRKHVAGGHQKTLSGLLLRKQKAGQLSNSCILCACACATESVCGNIYHSLLLSISVQCIGSHNGGRGRGRAAWTPCRTWSLNVLSLVSIDRCRPATWTCCHLGKSYLRGN